MHLQQTFVWSVHGSHVCRARCRSTDVDLNRRHSGAADVIVIHHRDEGRYVTSDFHVHAGEFSLRARASRCPALTL
eukprot:248164-Rhodomonas_salina.1